MAWLVPAIHVYATQRGAGTVRCPVWRRADEPPFEADFVEKNVDGRDKPGHDESWENRPPAQTPRSFIAREYALTIPRTIVARMSVSDMRVAGNK
jgi:hypothetical protein